MATAVLADGRLSLKSLLAVGPAHPASMPSAVEWFEASHPLPDERSVAAGRRALEVAAAVGPTGDLLILLSGGASALMSAPAAGISLADKRQTIERMMLAGADIHALNTVRKHLSKIKGGRLAKACQGATLTLAVSDVIGDDLSVIGSGPGVADRSTWRDAEEALERWGDARHPEAVQRHLRAGVRGELEDTPKPGDPALVRASARIIAGRADLVAAARREAESRGYRVLVVDDPTAGEARKSAPQWYLRADAWLRRTPDRACVMAAGETTVQVTGRGRGGRNQEFALALVEAVARAPREIVIASVGTDGIDGPTDAAGAAVDRTTAARAAHAQLKPILRYLDDNDAYTFFAALGDLIRTGPTDTNVGDLQILLADPVAP